MKIIHISDTHGPKGHTHVQIPECDVLIHSGDIGGRTNLFELTEFLVWFEKQPARKKIFIAGNHDLIMDEDWVKRTCFSMDSVASMILKQQFGEVKRIIDAYNVDYLQDSELIFEGVKFYGSPYTPSFHRQHWAFNADRGKEIQKVWAKIPSDVNVLITHGPAYGIFDEVEARYLAEGEDKSRGCEDLLAVIKKRLNNLKLHCSGHIHDNYGVQLKRVSNNRRVTFSNGAVLTNDYTQLVTTPLIINI